jgi:flagellin-like hook-associated protein FlgL
MSTWGEDGEHLGVSDGWDHLFVVNLLTGVVKGDSVGNPYENDSLRAIVLSPNGNYLAVRGESLSFSSDYVVYDTTVTLNEAVLTEAPGNTNDLAVSNSATLYYITSANVGGVNPGGIANLISSDGTNRQNLSNSTVAIQKFWATDFGSSFTFITAGNLTGENSAGVNQAFKYSSSGGIAQLTSGGLGGFAINTIQNVSGDGQTLIATSGSGTFAIDARRQTNLAIGTGTGASGVIANGVLAMDAAIRGLSDLDISTARGAQVALDSFKMNEKNLALARASLGAGLSRLESASRVTEARVLTLTEARSKITDIDVAEGIAQSTRLAILGDMQTAIFAQATKLQPTIALQLLGIS